MPWHFYLAELPGMLSPLTSAGVVAGIAGAVWRRDRFGLHCLGVAAGIVVWFSAYRFKEPRLITAALPFMVMLAALPVTRLVPAGGRGRRALLLGAALVVVLVANFVTVSAALARRRVLGEPSFVEAMRFLRREASREALVLGANYPQIHWYADRRAVELPPEPALAAVLGQAEWVVVTNFERGQPAYALALPTRAAAGARPDDVLVFRDPWFATALIRASALAPGGGRAGTPGAGNPPEAAGPAAPESRTPGTRSPR
jgi:hypothetical protein